MVEVCRSGQWWLVSMGGENLAWFVHSLDAHRFAIAMLHDGLATSVAHQNGAMVEK